MQMNTIFNGNRVQHLNVNFRYLNDSGELETADHYCVDVVDSMPEAYNVEKEVATVEDLGYKVDVTGGENPSFTVEIPFKEYGKHDMYILNLMPFAPRRISEME